MLDSIATALSLSAYCPWTKSLARPCSTSADMQGGQSPLHMSVWDLIKMNELSDSVWSAYANAGIVYARLSRLYAPVLNQCM